MTKFRKWLGVELVEVSLTEKLIAAAGGGLAIFTLMALTFWALPAVGAMAVLASMGASAVLLFGVPHGQLSQPWPVIAGHVVSAAIGVACARYISQPEIATACAVGLAIGAMHQFKCIHPPGGATAFTAVMGDSAIHDLGFKFVLFPVLTNAIAMVLLAVLINSAFKWRRYPVGFSIAPRPTRPAFSEEVPPPTHEEVVAAIKSLDSFVDISEEDLLRLIKILSRTRQSDHA
ncbi:MAG TPA: HPP family protein [Verrucomicrobiae bacterium]|nr:HPP family protein [Verrucomicrobiae bacterium]